VRRQRPEPIFPAVWRIATIGSQGRPGRPTRTLSASDRSFINSMSTLDAWRTSGRAIGGDARSATSLALRRARVTRPEQTAESLILQDQDAAVAVDSFLDDARRAGLHAKLMGCCGGHAMPQPSIRSRRRVQEIGRALCYWLALLVKEDEMPMPIRERAREVLNKPSAYVPFIPEDELLWCFNQLIDTCRRKCHRACKKAVRIRHEYTLWPNMISR